MHGHVTSSASHEKLVIPKKLKINKKPSFLQRQIPVVQIQIQVTYPLIQTPRKRIKTRNTIILLLLTLFRLRHLPLPVPNFPHRPFHEYTGHAHDAWTRLAT